MNRSNLKIILAASIGALLWAACSTVTPKVVQAGQISFDGTAQNSGLVSYDQTNKVGIITAHARDRYNGLIQTYGNRFSPPLTVDAGIIPFGNNFQLDAQHLEYFARMNRWRRSTK